MLPFPLSYCDMFRRACKFIVNRKDLLVINGNQNKVPLGLWRCQWSEALFGCMIQFLRMEIFIQVMCHHPRNLGFKFRNGQTIWIWRGYVSAITYTSLCKLNIMVTITGHIFINMINIFHGTFLVVKFTRVREKSVSFVWYQNLTKSEAFGPGSFY